MPQQTKKKLLIWLGVLFIVFHSHPGIEKAEAFSDQIIQRGATGDDVVELQARLQYNGFFDGTIDGVFGWSTYWSVRDFQDEFGLEIDGLVGGKMKDMLARSTEYNEEFVKQALEEGKDFTHYGGVPLEQQKGPKEGEQAPADEAPPEQAPEAEEGAPAPEEGEEAPPAGEEPPAPEGEEEAPEPEAEEDVPEAGDEEPGEQGNEANIQKATNVPDGYSENDIQIMSNAVHGEARGEPYTGKVAVAAVIINRVNSETFPNTVNGVIFEPLAFTAVADGQIWMEPDEESRKAVLDAINGQDPSGGAEYYFNPDTATSDWIWSRPQRKRIGKHVFMD
ncbi:spore cortex-lytic enzyme [Salsuginibacillus kocurii]|uniref:spore cortex-lytic enzyme n=1 Tax=Salsuginibacillus kocurii TaxID=427078 RepID=UPI00036767C5|nr:spore cortex-lytic enzyme [Salsuginibacillus kocurii]